jgi:hypothetical protein
VFVDAVAFRLALTFCLLVYSLLLIRWSGRRSLLFILPVLGLGLLAYLLPSTWSFVVLALLGLGWIRSGVCFPRRWPWAIGSEILLGGGGALLVGAFAPQSGLAWSLAVWMFGLVQALFFLLPQPSRDSGSARRDRFEHARRAAEQIIRSPFEG